MPFQPKAINWSYRGRAKRRPQQMMNTTRQARHLDREPQGAGQDRPQPSRRKNSVTSTAGDQA